MYVQAQIHKHLRDEVSFDYDVITKDNLSALLQNSLCSVKFWNNVMNWISVYFCCNLEINDFQKLLGFKIFKSTMCTNLLNF